MSVEGCEKERIRAGRRRYTRAGDVATRGAEALRESAHQHVDVVRVGAEVVNHSAAVRPQGTDAVRLIHI